MGVRDRRKHVEKAYLEAQTKWSTTASARKIQPQAGNCASATEVVASELMQRMACADSAGTCTYLVGTTARLARNDNAVDSNPCEPLSELDIVALSENKQINRPPRRHVSCLDVVPSL